MKTIIITSTVKRSIYMKKITKKLATVIAAIVPYLNFFISLDLFFISGYSLSAPAFFLKYSYSKEVEYKCYADIEYNA